MFLLRANLTSLVPMDEVDMMFNRSRPRPEKGETVLLPSSATKSNITATYMAMLDEGTRRELIELYKWDFEMFGYSPNKYLYL